MFGVVLPDRREAEGQPRPVTTTRSSSLDSGKQETRERERGYEREGVLFYFVLFVIIFNCW